MKNITKTGRLIILFLSISLAYYSCKKDEVYKPAEIETGAITDITFNSAKVSGSISDLGSGADEHGHCWSTNPEPTTSDFKTSLGAPATGSFTSEMTNLDMGVEYYVRTYVIQGEKIVYGPVKSFKTLNGVPELITSQVEVKTIMSVIAGGEVSIDGNVDVTARGVCWNTTGNPKVNDNSTSDSLGVGNFVSMLDSLEKNTKYYLRAYAVSSYGTGYGNEVEFEIVVAPGTNLTDSRDGKIYKTAQIGTQLWMAENLNHGMVIHDSVEATDNDTIEMYYYNNSDSLGNLYGGLYLWDEMMQYTTTASTQGVCPDGWHLPSDEEWMTLEKFLGMADSTVVKTSWRGTDNEGTKLKDESSDFWSIPGSNESGFSGIPGGRLNDSTNPAYDGKRFQDLGVASRFWTSSGEEVGNHAWYRGLAGKNVGRNDIVKHTGRSVRCVKD